MAVGLAGHLHGVNVAFILLDRSTPVYDYLFVMLRGVNQKQKECISNMESTYLVSTVFVGGGPCKHPVLNPMRYSSLCYSL